MSETLRALGKLLSVIALVLGLLLLSGLGRAAPGHGSPPSEHRP